MGGTASPVVIEAEKYNVEVECSTLKRTRVISHCQFGAQQRHLVPSVRYGLLACILSSNTCL